VKGHDGKKYTFNQLKTGCMNWIWQDLRYGLRGFHNQPGFTLLAVLALALGIGSATTIFSVIYNVLLDPMPYTDTRRVVMFQIHDLKESEPGGRGGLTVPEFLDYQEQNHVFDAVIGGTGEQVHYRNGEGTQLFWGGLVTPNAFQFLGVPALLGRGITPEDGKPGAPPVFVMSYNLWRKRFNLDASMVGRTFILNGTPRTLVGIMPPRFQKLRADMWRPMTLDRGDPKASQVHLMFQAHLKPGVALRQAEADINVIAHRLAQVYPKQYPKQFTVQMWTWIDGLVGHFRPTLYTLTAAVTMLLLIACTNVANMLLARASSREQEMAIRAALGGTRQRLIRQLLIEDLALAFGGAALGCVLAYGGIKALVALLPDGAIPSESVIELNLPVLLGSAGIAVLTVIIFGLAPALNTAKADIVEPLKSSGKGASGGFGQGKLRSTLVVVEVALSLVLLTGAGLLMRSFIALVKVDLVTYPNG